MDEAARASARSLMPFAAPQAKDHAEDDLACGEPGYAVAVLLADRISRGVAVDAATLAELRAALDPDEFLVAMIDDAIAV